MLKLELYLFVFGNALFVEGSPNLVFLRQVEERYRVKYKQGVDFRVNDHESHRLIVVFKRGRDGLYSALIRKRLGESIKVLVDTVHSRALKYTARDVVRWMAFPSDVGLQYDIMHGGILNNPVTSHDLEIAADIFGADVASLKGKMTVPTAVAELLLEVERATDVSQHFNTDVMEIDDEKFLVSLVKPMGLLIVNHIPTANSAGLMR